MLQHWRGGLGIGPTIVKRLVEVHGGTVEAISAGEGCGSAFTIRLRRLESLQTPDELPGLGASFGIP